MRLQCRTFFSEGAVLSRNVMMLSLGLAVVSVGCKSAPKSTIETRTTVASAPDWYSKPPQSSDRFYGTATAESRDMQLAVNKATAEGRARIAEQLGVKFGGLQKRFAEETGLGQDSELLNQFTQAYKLVSSEELVGSRTKEQKILPGEGVYRAYVLMELDVGEASKALMQRLNAQQQLMTRFRATQAYKDLNAEVEKLEQSRKP